MNGYDMQSAIRRRKGRAKRGGECDSGAARRSTSPVNPVGNDWFGSEQLPPKVVHSASVRRPIHIEPLPTSERAPAPQTITSRDMTSTFAAISADFGLTPTEAKSFLDALTKARLLLGYRHPATKFSRNPAA